ncbi:long-chain-fatty-acid--CoA ligase [Branchiibius cervicis]|uniref:Long-chain-fatty-acid--CoA ligase n=1 Tax=Branchiibius cervicis TaxID=908252 RepID=A0ABW2AWH5_9MICO
MQQPVRIYDVITANLASQPSAPALEYGDHRWTWTEVDDRIRRLAQALRDAGVEAGDRIATLDKNNAACLELTFAASLIGAVNAVVNFRLSSEEIRYVLDDSQAVLLFAGPDFVPIAAGLAAELPHLRRIVALGGEDDEYEAFLAGADPLTEVFAADDDTAFLQLYTSGTTGRPKGAMLTHRSVGSHTARVAPAYDMDARTVNLVAMPLFHVGGTCWALGSMYAGGRTIVVRDLVPDQLLALITGEQATHVFLVPAVIGMLTQVPGIGEAFASVKVLGYGGSPMPLPTAQAAVATFPSGLYSVYGMTEMSGTFCVLRPEDHRDADRPHLLGSAGRVIAGNEARVVDPATGHDVPVGQPGELLIRSEQIMSGYWRNPAATAATITDGWLHTGDIVRIDEEGYVYVVDRAKDMLISGGENVYPAEVERVLTEHPDIAEVAVVGAPHPTWGETPVAYVVPAPGREIDPDALITYARERLAHYKCPTSVVVLEALPRNAMAKILKQPLRDRAEQLVNQ